MKKYVLIFLLLILVGCSNIVEEQKTIYTQIKKDLLTHNNFTNQEDILFNITTSVARTNDEQIKYEVVLDNPEEEMHNIKALVIHNYLTSEIFPSNGIFEESIDLIPGTEDKLTMVGNIDTTKDIMDINLIIKIYVEYENEDGELKQIYYQSTKYE